MRVLPILVIWLLVDLFTFRSVSTAFSGNESLSELTTWLFWLIDLALLVTIVFFVARGKMAQGPNKKLHWLMALFMISIIPKLLLVPFLMLEDLYRFCRALYHAFVLNGDFSMGYRNVLYHQILQALLVFPVVGIIYGVIKGKYAYKVHKVQLKFKDLPEAFHGFKLTQISDVHSGSLDNKALVERGVELINQQASDIIVFTGDLVNNVAVEMVEWIDTFSKLKAEKGVYSILGNHDYGDYISWKNEESKRENLNRLIKIQKEMGFNLLMNEHVKIEKNGQSISLIGVENWGKRGFTKYGDLEKAIAEVDHHQFKILLSHDPSHWEAETLDHDKHIHLTLAGHTHGMQFGIEMFGIKWSPVKYIYKQWAGIYENAGKYLYVNRGFGFLGFPGRVGIMPEITVIELQRG